MLSCYLNLLHSVNHNVYLAPWLWCRLTMKGSMKGLPSWKFQLLTLSLTASAGFLTEYGVKLKRLLNNLICIYRKILTMWGVCVRRTAVATLVIFMLCKIFDNRRIRHCWSQRLCCQIRSQFDSRSGSTTWTKHPSFTRTSKTCTHPHEILKKWVDQNNSYGKLYVNMLLFEEVYCEISRTINSRYTHSVYDLSARWRCCDTWRPSVVVQQTMGSARIPGQLLFHANKLLFGRNAWGTAASTCLVAKKSSTLAYQPDISPAEFGIYACLLSSFPGYRAVHARPRVTVTSSKHIRLVSFTLDLVAVSLLCKIIILFCLILHSKHRKAIVHIFIRKRFIWHWQCPRLPIIHIYLIAM